MNPLKQIKQIWRVGRKHKKMLAFYNQYLSPGNVCFDIGAHTGEVSSVLLRLKCKVIGFEPLDSCEPKLTQLAMLNKEHFIYHKAAVSNQKGWAPLYVGSHPELSTLSTDFVEEYKKQKIFTWAPAVPVQTLTIQDAIDLYSLPYFIKMDAEGYEPLILEKLHTPIPYIQLEWNERLKKEAIVAIEHLERLGGYKYNWWPGETFSFAEPQLISATEMIKRLQEMPPHILTGEIWAVFGIVN
jgi:FkbM family methyltransferase